MNKDTKSQVTDAGDKNTPPAGPTAPKLGLDGNPVGGMSHLFGDTAAMSAAEKAERIGEDGEEEPGTDAQALTKETKEESKEETLGEGLVESEQKEEDEKEPSKDGQLEEGKEDKHYQALYDRTKQELELARELAADATERSLKQEKELDRLKKIEEEVAPHLSRLKTQLDVEAALKEVQVPSDLWTGDDGKGGSVCTNGDKLSYLMTQKPELLIDLIEKAADRAADKRFAEVAAARAKRSEIETRFETRHKVELSQKLINSINIKLSDGAKRVINDPNIPDDVKDDIIDQAYSKLAAGSKAASKVEVPPNKDGDEDKVEEKTAEELRADAEEKELKEKQAALLRSKSNLNQKHRSSVSFPIDATQKAYDDMKDWQKKTKGNCPLL